MSLSPDIFVSGIVAIAWWLFLRRLRYSMGFFAIFSLIGTTGHELMHALVGWVTGARPVSFSLFPRREGGRWVLGSVSFRNIKVWNAAPVAFAPLLLAPVAYILFTTLMVPAFQREDFGAWFLYGYLCAVFLISCIPSVTDIRVGLFSGLMYFGIGYGIYQVTS